MSFKELDIGLIYDTSTVNVIDELIVPLLCNTKNYYRGVGYFSSAWLRLVSKGLQDLVENRGKIYLLTSPQLCEEDWHAIMNGEQAKTDEVIYRSIRSSMEGFDQQTKQETLNLFSWLIADEYIELKFVICSNLVGNYHDKIAIFEDEENNRICLHGSLNDSLQATYNGESVSVFKSWIIGQDAYLNEHYMNFQKLYKGENEYFQIREISDMLIDEFKKYQLPERPYKVVKKKSEEIHLPNYITELNPYQTEAIYSFIANKWRGIFEMATGTGKTITAIETSRRYLEENKKMFLIITVPFKHLVTQWENVLLDFGFTNIICCYNGTKTWKQKAKRNVKNFNVGLHEIVCCITTYKTASSEDFLNVVGKIKDNVFFIADECHYIGSGKYGSIMKLDNIRVRLGLSATPDRWFDDIGTNKLRTYFDKTVYEYSLSTAIENGFLTRYDYYPIVVHLKAEELEEYINISKKISKIYPTNGEYKDNSYLQILLIKRSAIISKAMNKKILLRRMLAEAKQTKELNHALIYCAKGESKDLVQMLAQLEIKVHDFVYDVSDKQREKILDQFDEGDIEALVAIKCLDEGVDIPSTQTAYFLASTSNPREFVQRRGRILRKLKGKSKAYLYDFIIMPEPEEPFEDEKEKNIILSLVRKELPRFAEFAHNADNKYQARKTLQPYLKVFNMEYLLDMLPYEIYHELYHEKEDAIEEVEDSEEY